MNFLEDMIYVNKSVLDKSFKSITKNWMIILTGFLYTIINLLNCPPMYFEKFYINNYHIDKIKNIL